ncbi:MAG TPA: hypothetical protein VM848_19035 [Acidimicrobiia bacterium]|nr:hypothetical protein [Acidimicrobiia bacterium]
MSRKIEDRPVTRTEIAYALRFGFGLGGTDRTRLIEAAVGGRARPQVCDLLRQLPDVTYHHIRDVWKHLDHVPVE